ncbi:adenylate kinase 8 [Anopheles ziemanni]|uniref:adenylate kinase 8 n=1 Tax=Anopheles coustani TaxID=139045 RepID=UPI00265B624C|nr:adenylate kinase 8 [Anopheles coustani]XP_058177752.1 adenylate kinase 8 [Anopheles ziemanni]
MDVQSYNFLEIESRLAFYPTEVMVYFEKHHIFQIVFDLMLLLNKNRPQCIEQFVADNIESIAKKYTCTNAFINASDNIDASVSNLDDVHKKIVERSNFIKIISPHAVVRHFQRIVIIGRPGSGKHRIGRWLSERLGVTLVSMTDLLAEHSKSHDGFGMALKIGSQKNSYSSELLAAITQRRLLQPDCLTKGWILTDFPNTAHDVASFFRMLITPNMYAMSSKKIQTSVLEKHDSSS